VSKCVLPKRLENAQCNCTYMRAHINFKTLFLDQNNCLILGQFIAHSKKLDLEN